jgi:hypothetical protein
MFVRYEYNEYNPMISLAAVISGLLSLVLTFADTV